jgi:hypothetical protein
MEADRAYRDEVLGTIWSEDWQKDMPITLVHYDNDPSDLHIQSGDHWDSALKFADDLLKQRGMVRTQGNDGMIGPTGVYMTVEVIS